MLLLLHKNNMKFWGFLGGIYFSVWFKIFLLILHLQQFGLDIFVTFFAFFLLGCAQFLFCLWFDFFYLFWKLTSYYLFKYCFCCVLQLISYLWSRDILMKLIVYILYALLFIFLIFLSLCFILETLFMSMSSVSFASFKPVFKLT